jgi:phosphate starvation-inducible PhoH-like protein
MLDPGKLTAKPFRARTEKQSQVHRTISEHDLTFLEGPAGTGKTLIAAVIAVEALITRQAKNVIIARPAVEAGESVGFLKGTLEEKVGPFVRPVLDNLAIFLGAEIVNALVKQGTIEITSLTYVRGRTFNDAVVIFDEMQNATPEQLKMCLTRAGENCKMLITADRSQCDLPRDQASAVDDFEIFRDRPGIAFVEFENRDVVRSKLVKTVLAAYSS